MKCMLFSILLFSCLQVAGQDDYTVHINDTALKISLDKKYDITVNGNKLVLFLSANDILNYNDGYVSFSYPKGLNVSKTMLKGGIEQIVIMSAEGTGLLIQEYANLDPSGLNEMMLKEISKESINYGFNLKREDYKLKVNSGQEVDVNKAVLKYKDDTNIYEVISFGKKDSGVLLMTIKMDDSRNSAGQKLIELMWKTLSFK